MLINKTLSDTFISSKCLDAAKIDKKKIRD